MCASYASRASWLPTRLDMSTCQHSGSPVTTKQPRPLMSWFTSCSDMRWYSQSPASSRRNCVLMDVLYDFLRTSFHKAEKLWATYGFGPRGQT